MKFHSKKSQKGNVKSVHKVPGLSYGQNGSDISDMTEFPMKPFKGTKSYLDKCEDNNKTLNIESKRKSCADWDDQQQVIQEKLSKYDPLNVMSTLEQFSDVWNDCPNVENPKSNFEIVPNHKIKVEINSKENNFEHRTKKPVPVAAEKHISSNQNRNEKMCSFKSKITEEFCVSNKHHWNSYENKNKSYSKGNESNKSLKAEHVITVPGKYNSKLAEIKRKKAVQEQSQLHADQKNIIKKALSSMDSQQQVNKKVVFSDAEDIGETQEEPILKSNKTKTQKLFDDDDSSDADLELKVNSQFEGKKGQKLLELQSKFASDSRFTLDSRFHDSESEHEEDGSALENVDVKEEKRRQLEILESIVKKPIRPLSETKKILPAEKYGESLMVRFDPTREDHQKYLLKPQKPLQEEGEVKEKKNKSKKEIKALQTVDESKPKVSNEKVYAVKEDLKEVLKKENKTEFSLLKLFGSRDEDTNTIQDEGESIKKIKYATKNPFKYDSSESESEEGEVDIQEKPGDNSATKPSFPSWRTTFFFTDNDSRLKEAEEFLKGSENPEDDQEFVGKRKILKDFIRHKLKNSNRKKDPFKKKLGGVKKKVFRKKKGK